MLLAQEGVRTLILDDPSASVAATRAEALTRAGVLLLSRWGVLDDVVAHGVPAVRRTVLHHRGYTASMSVKPSFGIGALYAPTRHLLQTTLLARALDAGAELRSIAEVVDITVRDGRVVGVHARGLNGRVVEHAAPLVIGADGPQSTMARLVGSTMSLQSRLSAPISYGYWTGLTSDSFDWIFGPLGRAGVVPCGDQTACVFASPSRDHGDGGGVDTIIELVESGSIEWGQRLRGAQAPSEAHTWNRPAGSVRTAHGPGWALVGSAGFFKDPTSVHGSTDELRDAELLARALLGGSGSERSLDHALGKYEARRDLYGLPLFDVVERLAGQVPDSEVVPDLWRQLNSAMVEEVEMLARLDPREAPR
ncbi:MAG: monooxygenase FAD-binding [Acidimicrobiia bacterium]|nr:monooxygenase FAD-binding [Acidimicrobiia bacterium]